MTSPQDVMENSHASSDTTRRSVSPYDVDSVRSDFPILSRNVYGRPLVYFDNAASAQKPQQVIDAETGIYERDYANVHRGAHFLSEQVTKRFEDARIIVQKFLNANHAHEIIFTRNGTEAINLVAASFGRSTLSEGDEIIITELEHHANIVPWQLLRDEKKLNLKIAPISDDGQLLMDEFEKLLSPKTKLVAISHMSNVLGTILPVGEIIERAHALGAKVLLDGCQAVTHLPVDVRALDCDFYVFSGHKLYGPSGIGILFGKETLLDAMPPYQGGGEMINRVTFENTTWAPLPHKFEAGTPAIAQAIALGSAIDYVTALGIERIAEHELDILTYSTNRLSAISGLNIIGTSPGESKRSLLHLERCSSARYCHRSRSFWSCDSGRTSLCASANGSDGYSRYCARIIRPI